MKDSQAGFVNTETREIKGNRISPFFSAFSSSSSLFFSRIFSKDSSFVVCRVSSVSVMGLNNDKDEAERIACE